MGNYHILNEEATSITAEDSWYAIETAELPEPVSIKNLQLSELLHKEERLDVILPLTGVIAPTGLLNELLDIITARTSRMGLWADTSVSTEQLDQLLQACKDAERPLLNNLDLIVLYQPSFVDGRSFSQARHLRQQGFEGEIRISGDFGRDQIAYLKRAGVNSFVIPDEKLTDDIVSAFHALPSSYDGSVASQLPMFR
ncbi:DUF934 domain-containing protein [uncultured Psychrobacter sp.]|uniref:DUF934 domain-containing protein n=1 Tax=uncultured Psychrobacter sp. TaxID=259303 RepID=UPI00259AA176|nr:DUF934 domain-containing protein [uncultured Psychrobacter sp.]